MTITESLRDDAAKSRSITDAIDGLAFAMGGGVGRRSVRSTDRNGQIVEQTLTTDSGRRVGVKGSEREVPEHKSEEQTTGGLPRTTWDGEYWVLQVGSSQVTSFFTFNVDDDERVIINIAADDAESGISFFRISELGVGGSSVTWEVDDAPLEYVGEAGRSVSLSIVNNENTVSQNGRMTVYYSPVVEGLAGSPFSISFPSIPSEFVNAIPKLLPTAEIVVTGGPAIFNTRLRFFFQNGLRPWWGGAEFVRDVALVVKAVGGASLPWAGVSAVSVSALRWESGSAFPVAVSDDSAAQASGGLWPAFVGYFNVDDEIFNYTPLSIDIDISHGAGTVIPSSSLTLGYFIVRGAD